VAVVDSFMAQQGEKTSKSQDVGGGVRPTNLTIMARAGAGLLIVQYLLGMFLNLFFISLPAGLSGVAAIFTSGAGLALHATIGFVLLILLLAMVLTALRASDRFGSYVSIVSLIGTIAAVIGGVGFTVGGQSNALSYLMSIGFLVAFATFGSLAGRGGFYINKLSQVRGIK
jgi:hypothetical protein